MPARIFLFLIIAILGSCALSNQGVYYSEMSVPPHVLEEDKKLEFTIENSSRNPALIINKFDVTVNHLNKELLVNATQSIKKKRQKTFEFKLEKLGISDLNGWTIYWIDPDGKKTELDINAILKRN